MSNTKFRELTVPGFYIDTRLHVVFIVREFLIWRGLPDNRQVRAIITRGVLETFHPTPIVLVNES